MSARMFHASRPGVRSRRLAQSGFATAELRNLAIVGRYEAGELLAAIGADLGYTREWVRQIVDRSGALMPLECKCAVVGCAIAPRSAKTYCYRHRIRFERYGDPARSRRSARLKHGTVARYRNEGCRCDRCRKASADQRREYLHRMHPEWRFMPDRAPRR